MKVFKGKVERQNVSQEPNDWCKMMQQGGFVQNFTFPATISSHSRHGIPPHNVFGKSLVKFHHNHENAVNAPNPMQ